MQLSDISYFILNDTLSDILSLILNYIFSDILFYTCVGIGIQEERALKNTRNYFAKCNQWAYP